MSQDEEIGLEHDEEALADRRREERRPVEEAGGGESEGFELAEHDLVANAEDADEQSTVRILDHAGDLDEEATGAEYGEADEERLPD